MKHVSIVIPQGAAVLKSIVRVFKIFNWVNDYLADNGGRPLFDLHLVGMAPRADLYGGIFSVMPDLTLADGPTFDLIIIPALAGDISKGLKSNAAFIPWMKKQYKMGSEIASLCTGAFLLAATGLMDGNKPTTHWFVAADCRNAFCQIKLGAERMIMKERRIHTRRGAYSSLNLLIEKFAGAAVAMACSKIFETDFNRECQSVVTIFNKQRRRKGRGIEAAQQFVDNNLRGKISREQFAEMFVLNRRNLKRSFENSTTNTLVGDMQTVKLEAIQKRPEASYGNTEEVMHEVCYNNSRAFRDIFNKMAGF
jgi:transcriptional regulator GlxA family with amidase domain